jgi:hypothetical protein
LYFASSASVLGLPPCADAFAAKTKLKLTTIIKNLMLFCSFVCFVTRPTDDQQDGLNHLLRRRLHSESESVAG